MALIVRDLTVEIDNKRIVEKVSFDVRAGDKVGLVGRNGAKTTPVFRALGGRPRRSPARCACRSATVTCPRIPAATTST
jgi:ABC-type hemin transport system ATPase subunit